MTKTKVVVAGSSGFIGGHLVRALKAKGYFVIGMDILPPMYEQPDEYLPIDLRKESTTEYAFAQAYDPEEVYNLACLMGGMGFIGDSRHNYDIMVGSSKIVANVIECSRKAKIGKSFFSSSACVYNMLPQNEPNCSLKETDAYPAMPDLVYGWQKLFSEQMYEAAHTKGMSVRVARFHNIFGPEGTYAGGKEKAPAALCRKVAQAEHGDTIEVWGHGKQTRSFLYIDECIEGVFRLMQSDWPFPINIGSSEQVSINGLAQMIIDIAGKRLTISNIEGPTGVAGRNSNNERIQEVLGWSPTGRLIDGLKQTYSWINQQINYG